MGVVTALCVRIRAPLSCLRALFMLRGVSLLGAVHCCECGVRALCGVLCFVVCVVRPVLDSSLRESCLVPVVLVPVRLPLCLHMDDRCSAVAVKCVLVLAGSFGELCFLSGRCGAFCPAAFSRFLNLI